MSERTHFGFEEVPLADKKNKVHEVFSSVATRYDVMNDLMSLGLHRWWKIFAVTLSRVKAGDKILDIATGTGDLARAFAKRGAQVWASDINADMLTLGCNRNLDAGFILPAVVANAEKLPFGQAYFDCVSVAFGLRNMTDKDQALREMGRVLKPGGRILVLEFSQVWKPLEPLYDWYSFKVIPKLGAKIAGDEKSYRYLAESIRRHPDQKALSSMMQQAGFEQVTFYNLCAGVVALHLGTRPA